MSDSRCDARIQDAAKNVTKDVRPAFKVVHGPVSTKGLVYCRVPHPATAFLAHSAAQNCSAVDTGAPAFAAKHVPTVTVRDALAKANTELICSNFEHLTKSIWTSPRLSSWAVVISLRLKL